MKYLFPIGLLLTLLGFSGGSWHFLSASSPAVIPAGRYLFIPGLLLTFTSLGWSLGTRGVRGGIELLKDTVSLPTVWAVGLLFLFLSDWPDRPFGFIPVQWFRGEIILGGIFVHLCLYYRSSYWIHITAACSILVCIWSFFTASEGRLLFSDDHAMFLFRLQLLKENFPVIPFWTPLWNAGIDARDFFATGALAPFLVSAPLVYLFDVASSYNWIVVYLLWILTPLSSFFAARLLGATVLTGLIAAMLSVSSSLFWYRWTLKYGTMGFTVATALIPLVLALGWRFITRERVSVYESILSVVTLSLMLAWTPSGIAVIVPLTLVALPSTVKLLTDRRKLLTIIAILAINIPVICTLWRVSAVDKFLSSHKENPTVSISGVPDGTVHPTGGEVEPASVRSPNTSRGRIYRHKASGLDLQKSMKEWQEFSISANPLLLLCAVPALFFLPRAQRVFGFIVSGWLTILGTVAVPLLPQLELDRMLVILGITLTYPVANFLSFVFLKKGGDDSFLLLRPTQVIFGAFLIASPLATTSIIMNRTSEQYAFATPEVQQVVDMVKQESGGGRILFTGCVLHQLSGGHLAPLAILSSTQMAASSYAHNIWHYEHLVPASFMKRDDPGIIEYFDYMNGTIVFAHEPYWLIYFESRPDLYQEIWRGDSFTAFKRKNYASSYGIGGEVRLTEVTSYSITFTTDRPSVVLKYKFFPFLRSTSCSISPFRAGEELELVKLDGCPINTPITIRSSPPLERILGPKHHP